MRRKHDLPIILSHKTRTGILIFPNRKMGGRDLVIVGLNKEIPSGDRFDLNDVGWVKAALHFTDVETMKITAKIINEAVSEWEKEESRKDVR